jgi:hypothetical protein
MEIKANKKGGLFAIEYAMEAPIVKWWRRSKIITLSPCVFNFQV